MLNLVNQNLVYKLAINLGMQVDIDSGIESENNLFSLCFTSVEQKEGMKAFLEKRKANFWKIKKTKEEYEIFRIKNRDER